MTRARPALPFDYTCFADGTPFEEIFRIGYCIRGICTSDKYFFYKYQIFQVSSAKHV